MERKELSETDIVGFDQLFSINYDEAQQFIQRRQSHAKTGDYAELELLRRELEEKNFEIQKLNWQLSEREKELKASYEEMHRVMEINKRLNNQLHDYEQLTAKQEALLDMLGSEPSAGQEPILPKFL